MNEQEMIAALEDALRHAKRCGFKVDFTEECFDVGEWLLALEGLENVAKQHTDFDARYSSTFRSIRRYFDGE